MNKKKYFKVLILFFLFISIYLIEIYINLRSAKGMLNVVVEVNCPKDFFEKIKVYKISPSGNVDEFYKNSKNDLFYFLDNGYFKQIKIEISGTPIEIINNIDVKIGKKDFIYNLDKLLNDWKYDNRNNILYSPGSIKSSRSLILFFKNIINWPGDFNFFVLPLIKYIIIFIIIFLLFYSVNTYLNKELSSNTLVLKDENLINKIDKWLLLNEKNLTIYNMVYFSTILIIIIFALFLRMYYNHLPYASGDVWGYIGPAINYFDGKEFTHIFGRSFPYPFFILVVLSIFKDFSFISLIQHISGILAAVVFLLAWRNIIKLFKYDNKFKIIHDFVGLAVISLYLFFDKIINFEHQLTRESIYPLFVILQILFFINYIINIKSNSGKLYLWGSLFFINNYFLFVYQPRWGFTLLFCLIIYISGIFFIKNKTINKILLLIIIPSIISFLFIFLPEKVLIKNETATEVFLAQHLFFGHAKIIDMELEKDINDSNFNRYDKEILKNIRKAFHEDFNTSQTKHKYLGYDFNRLVYSGWITGYIRDRMSREEYQKFCNYYFKKAVFRHPFKYLKKVILELSQFYNFNGQMYSYRSYRTDGELYRSSYENLNKPEQIKYIPFITYLDAVEKKMNSIYDLKEINIWLSNIMFFLFSKTYLIILIIFLIIFIYNVISSFKNKNGNNNLLFQYIIICLFLFNFFISLTISTIYTYDVRRYFEDQTIIILFSQMICLEYLIVIMFNLIKNKMKKKDSF